MIDWRAGRAATTRWSLLEAGDDTALLSLEPVTGRTHQLRLHLAVSGYPILGDDLYATGTAREDDRLMLHAAELTVPHPDDGRPVRFAANSPLPAP